MEVIDGVMEGGISASGRIICAMAKVSSNMVMGPKGKAIGKMTNV